MPVRLVLLAAAWALTACATAVPEPTTVAGLRAALEQAPTAEHEALVSGFVRRQPRLPLIDGDRATLFVRSDSSETPRIVADFNGWGSRGDDFDTTAGTMARLGESAWFALDVFLDPDARIEYAIAWGADRLEVDPGNPDAVESFGRRNSVLRMPGYREPPELEALASVDPERLRALDVASRVFGETRRVLVYLPPGPRDEQSRLPAIYVHDGESYVEALDLPRLVETLVRRGTIQPVVAVFTTPADRSTEYSRDGRHRTFLVEELIPAVEAAFPVARAPSARAIVGSSRGGLAALDAATALPGVFGLCGLVAPAIQPTTIDREIARGAKTAQRFFVLLGKYDTRWVDDGRRVVAALREAGQDVSVREAGIGHSLPAWRPHFVELLRTLFPSLSEERGR